jgi:transcriptional regulator of acetoin/glycerol metabolism
MDREKNSMRTIPASLTFGKHSIDIRLSISLDDFLNAPAANAATHGRPRKLSKEEARLLNALFNAGVQAEDVAEAFGISRTTLWRYRKRFERQQAGRIV